MVTFDQRQDHVGPRLRDDQVAGANIHGRTQADVELSAVIHRHRMQHDIARAHLPFHYAAHVLPEHRIMGQHRPFRARFRTTRVNDLHQIVGPDLDARLVLLVGQQCVVRDPLARVGRRARRKLHQPLHLGVGPRRLFGG